MEYKRKGVGIKVGDERKWTKKWVKRKWYTKTTDKLEMGRENKCGRKRKKESIKPGKESKLN